MQMYVLAKPLNFTADERMAAMIMDIGVVATLEMLQLLEDCAQIQWLPHAPWTWTMLFAGSEAILTMCHTLEYDRRNLRYLSARISSLPKVAEFIDRMAHRLSSLEHVVPVSPTAEAYLAMTKALIRVISQER